MKRKFFVAALCLMLVFALLPFAAMADSGSVYIEIRSAADLEQLAENVNDGVYEDTASLSVVLMNNIDLSAYDNWTPIGIAVRSGKTYSSGYAFKGTFDGQGFTISGLKIDASPANLDTAYGLFGVVDGGTVKDLKLENVSIDVSRGECVGAAIGLMVNGSTASGITVSGSVNAVRGLGGIVGRMTVSGTIENCINYAAISGSGANVGGIVGAAYYTEAGSEMYITACDNHGTVTCTAGVVGGIAGLSAAVVSGCTNTAAVTGNGADVAGIVAEQQNAGSVTGCANNADITNNSINYGTGGVVGWVRYNGDGSSYARKNIIIVSGNTNSGSIYGGNDGGGIVGAVYNAAVVTGNENYAPTISGNTFAGGIVGNLQFTENPVGNIPMYAVNIYNNVSLTPADKISAQNKSQYAYDNTSGKNENVVVAENSGVWTAEVNGEKFATLSAAWEKALSLGKTSIKLLSSVTDQSALVLNGAGLDVTLELNGYDIGFAENAAFQLRTGKLTINGEGKVYEESPYFAPVIVYGTADTDTEASCVLSVNEGVTLQGWAGIFVNGTSIVGNDNVRNANGVEIYVNGAVLDSVPDTSNAGGHALYVQGTISEPGENPLKIELNSARLTATSGTDGNGDGMYLAGYAETTINNSTITAGEQGTGIEIRAGMLTISGSTSIQGGSGEVTKTDNGNGLTTSSVALAVAQHTTKLPLEVIVNGGEFVGSAAFVEHNPQNNEASSIDKVSVVINGGVFTSTQSGEPAVFSEDLSGFISKGSFSSPVPAEYLSSQLAYELYSGGEYSYYSTLADAIENAGENAVIKEVNGSGADAKTYTVTIDPNNGGAVTRLSLGAGIEYPLPAAPSNSGYVFLGWRSGDTTYKAGDVVPITSDTTFVAVWGNLPDVNPSEPSEPETPVFPFYDVTARDWYYSAVKYVYEKGLMDGVDVGVFAPNDTLTRAMVWTIIARAEGVDTTGGATWYAKAQEWVTAQGISDGENPNAAITRQELVTMLYRLAGEPAVSGTITAPDAASVSTWAQSAMTWAMNIGLVEGDENGAVTPTATATRAQAAALIMRYLEA